MKKTYWICICILCLFVRLSGESIRLNDLSALCPKGCSCTANENLSVMCREMILSHVPTCAQFKSLIEMDLSFNSINEVKPDFFESCSIISTLIMKNGKIEKIAFGAFDSLKDLQTLDLSHNELHYIPHDLVIHNQKLKCFSLSHNPLTMLQDDGPILTSSSLLHLHMENCMISELSTTSLSQLPNLQSLDLSRNELKVLFEATLLQLPNLNEVYLSDNPWTCNEEFEKLVCFAYHKPNSQPQTMHCYTTKFLRRKYTYIVHIQHELCWHLSETKSSTKDMKSTAKEFVNIANKASTVTSDFPLVNTKPQYKTDVSQTGTSIGNKECDKAFVTPMTGQSPKSRDETKKATQEYPTATAQSRTEYWYGVAVTAAVVLVL